MTTKSGFYKHGKSHEDGGIPVLVDSSSPIEVELHEYKICSNAMESTKIFEFKDKTNKEILDEIFQYSNCEFKQNEASSGDFIICKLAVLDKKKRNITGTAKEIINVMQSEKSCNVTNDSKEYKDGGSLNQRNLIYIGDVGSSNVDESKKINWGKNEYDNKNRYEISDEDLELINFDNLYKKASENKGKLFVVKLNEIIKHDTLFEAYPDLKNIDVEYKYDEKDKGFSAYNLINNNIKYNFYGEDEFIKSMENALRKNGKSLPTNEQLSRRRFALRRRVLLHELQHYVQYYENHGQGSSWLREYRRILQERGIDERTISTNERNILIDESKKLNRSYLGEMESKDVEFRINLTLDERKNKKPFELLPYTVDSVIVKLKDNKLKDGGEINNEYIIFFKSKLNNDIIYSNVKAESLQSAIDRTKSLYNWTEILWIKGFELNESNEGVQFLYEAIKNYWSSNKLVNVDLVDGQIIFTGYGNSVAFDFIAKFLKKENNVKVFDGGYLFNDDLDIEINPDFTFDDSKIIEYLSQYKNGGEINDNDETYTKWKNLVNMSKSELEKFYNSEDGKKAGLSASEAKSQGIDSGRESARWIMKMKDTPKSEWTSDMWRWAKKQISFISRMSGVKGDLYDDKGNKTRKHTSLLIWGHNPKKYNDGGEINKNDKIMNDIKLSSRAIIDVNGEKLVKEIYGNKEHLIELLYSLDSKNLFQIYYIFVSKDIRRLGIGSKLMDLAKNKAIELGFDNILCLVADYKGEDYDNLVSFYKKNGFEFVENSDKKMTLKLDTEFNNGSLKLMKWYIDWYKGISDKMNITLSLPNLLSPFKENNVVIMDLFEKIDQTIDAKKYLQEIINKADEYKVTLYLEPIPRYKYFLDDAEKIRRISKEYLISYYEKFGFELTPNRQFMKRNFKEKLKNGGELTTNESCEKFIKEHENIFKNGYYSFVKNIGIFADSYGGKMPKIDSLIIISYNSGGQNNLKVTDTINPIVLQKQIGELIEEESGIPKIIILKHLTSSKRVNEDIFDIIKNNNVIIIDRDEVVCYNLINKLKNGGELKTKEMENKEILIGGKADKLTIEDIAKKHNVDLEYAKEQLKSGLKVESEHTNDVEKQKEIVLDHLSEFIDYYKELEKMEEKLKTGSEEINLEYENLVKNLDSKLKTDNHLVINSAVNELLKLVSDNPYLYTKYLTKIHSIPKRYRVGTSPYIKDNELPKVIEWLKENNINLFELLDVKEYQLPKYKPFSIKSDDKTFMAIHSEFASTDDLRPQMLGSNFNEHGVVTTDAHRLLFTEYRGESSEKFGNYCYTKKCFSQEDNVQSSKYPNWSVIIPRESSHKEVLNSKYLYDFIKNSINLQLNNNYNQVAFEYTADEELNYIGFNVEFLSDCILAMSKLGHKDLEIAFSAPNRAALIYPIGQYNKIISLKTDFCLVMPVILYGDYRDENRLEYNFESNCSKFKNNDKLFCFDSDIKKTNEIQNLKNKITEIESKKAEEEIKPIIEAKNIEPKKEISSEQKEWKDAISTFNELISIGGSESELKEWNEAIDTFKMLI